MDDTNERQIDLTKLSDKQLYALAKSCPELDGMDLGDGLKMTDEQMADALASITPDQLMDPEPMPKLQPARQRLADHLAAERRAADDLERARAARARLIDELDGIEATKNSVAELVQADASSILAAVRAGAAWALDRLKIKERQVLELKLTAARHGADVGANALAALDREIARLEAEAYARADRQAELVSQALLEAADGVAADYIRIAGELRHAIARLAALSEVAGLETIAADDIKVILPGFDVPALIARDASTAIFIAPSPATIERAAAPWRALAAALATNPRADADRILVWPKSAEPAPASAQDVSLMATLRAGAGYTGRQA